MPTPTTRLESEVTRISRRRDPWPPLAPLLTDLDATPPVALGADGPQRAWAEQTVSIVRGHDTGNSDRCVRTLATIGAHDQDATTLLVAGLNRLLQPRLRHGQSAEFRNDALTELVLVIADAIERGDLQHLDRLATRLTWRAHTRLHKSAKRARQRGTVHPVTTDPVAPDMLPTDGYGHPEPDIADIAATRADLRRFAAAVTRDVATGTVPDRAWAAYRDRRLARVIARRRPATSSERRSAAQAAPAIRRHATTYLTVHT
jgi:hypothetical protein